MKINRNFFPELVAMNDPTRKMLHGLQLDVSRKRLIATNGHALVSLPVETQPTDRDGMIPVETLIAARKHAQKEDVARGYAKACAQASKRRKRKPDPTPAHVSHTVERDAAYAPVEQTIPYRGRMPLPVQIAFNPTLLRALADAIDSSDYVALAFDPADYNGPIRVYGSGMSTSGNEVDDDPIAVLMPCRR